MSEREADDPGHADAVAAQLRQAARDGDLPAEIRERSDVEVGEDG